MGIKAAEIIRKSVLKGKNNGKHCDKFFYDQSLASSIL